MTARRALEGDLGTNTPAGELCGNDIGKVVELDYTDPYEAGERRLIGTLHRIQAGPGSLTVWVKREASGWPVDEPVELHAGHEVTVGPMIDRPGR